MEPALIGTRLASAAIGPLLKKLLVSEVPGAGLTGKERSVRLSSLVSFRGEKRTLTEKDVRKLAATLVERSAGGSGETPFPADETEAVAHTLGTTLLSLGDLDMDDVQAVRLGHRDLARRLRAAAPAPDGLSTDSVLYLESMTEWACLHILEFFTRRSTFVARSLVEQTRGQAELIAKVDALLTGTRGAAAQNAADAAFERRYLAHLAKKHGRLTIYGVTLNDSPGEWPLDMAYLSLEATGADALPGEAGQLVRQQHDRPVVRADLALASHDRLLLRGLAGSGKSTLVQWLTVSAATGGADGMAYLQGRIPFVLPLRTLTRHGERLPTPDRFLSAAGSPLTPPEGWADRVLAAGRGLVLVDGIDEIPEAERGRARDWLRDLLSAYDGNRWLVTSRPTAVDNDWLARDGFTELTLSPMSRTEVATFVRRWHRAAGPEAAPYEQPLLDALRTAEHVAQLATNPLMCGLVCALHRDRRGYLPRGRKALYEAALSMLLARRDRERDMGTPYGVTLDEAPQIQIIQRLAYWLTLNGRLQMDRTRAESIVTEAVPAIPEAAACGSPEQIFTHLLHRSGLLREPTADTIDFVHRTFQDYLAAKALVDHWDIGVLVGHATDDTWEDVIRMAVGHARPRECAEILRELLDAADRAQDRQARLRLVLLAATALEHATEVPPDVRKEVLARTAEVIPPRTPDEARELAAVGRLVLDLLPGPETLNAEEAEMVVITASHITIDAAIPYLSRFAAHGSMQVRAQLMWAWQRFDAQAYGEAVIARLDPTGLRYIVTDDERSAELLRLGLRPDQLEIDSAVSDERATELLAHCDLRQLVLASTTANRVLAALTAQNKLDMLSLQLPDEVPWRLADLPDDAPLTRLHLGSFPADGLHGLAHYQGLRHLVLSDDALTADSWRVLASLPHLRYLFANADSLDFCPEDIVLPWVETLFLVKGERRAPSLERVARALPALQKVIHRGLILRGVEHLPPHVQVGS
ncbi:NACHT domain-containing protein [Streptomyces exfoliatus]|uniref:NACHT domain-containing protein n=1 Tax=Streptomyces exfoliatus TaxID=1905 RepID=A0ABV3D7B3_STREX